MFVRETLYFQDSLCALTHCLFCELPNLQSTNSLPISRLCTSESYKLYFWHCLLCHVGIDKTSSMTTLAHSFFAQSTLHYTTSSLYQSSQYTMTLVSHRQGAMLCHILVVSKMSSIKTSLLISTMNSISHPLATSGHCISMIPLWFKPFC